MRQNKTKQNWLGKVAYSTFLISSLITSQSCTKNSVNSLSHNDNQLVNSTSIQGTIKAIDDFYSLMKIIKNGGQSTETFSVDSTNFLIEGTYNYRIVQHDIDAITTKKIVSIEANIDNKNRITASEASRVMYQFKDSLTTFIQLFNENDNSLRLFDLSYAVKGNKVNFTASIRIGSPIILPNPCTVTLIPANQSYIILDRKGLNTVMDSLQATLPTTFGDYMFYPMGQAVMNMTTKYIDAVNFQKYKPGAAYEIRHRGIYKQLNCKKPAAQSWFNIQEIEIPTFDVIEYPIHQYSTLLSDKEISNTEGFDGVMRYFPEIGCGQNSNYPNDTDPARDLKTFLTEPMVQFYANRVPSVISKSLPIGAYFVDLHIETATCMCCVKTIAGHPLPAMGSPSHIYHLYHASSMTTAPLLLPISSL